MDVEQRHHAHGHIIVRERIAASDVLRRDGKVRVLQRNALRTPRAAARVQHQGDVVHRRRRCRCAASHTAQAGRAGCIDVDPENWNAVACGSTRVVCSFRRENQDLRGRVFQIETELVFLVRGVQRSGRSGDRRGQKRHDRRQAVRQGRRNSIAAAHAGGGELLGNGQHLRAQCSVGHADVLFGKDDGDLVGRRSLDQLAQRVRNGCRIVHDAFVRMMSTRSRKTPPAQRTIGDASTDRAAGRSPRAPRLAHFPHTIPRSRASGTAHTQPVNVWVGCCERSAWGQTQV